MTINISISILPDGAIPVDVMGGENNNCPLATQDEELNAENRQIAVEEADYREALRAEYVCGNCSAYNQTDDCLLYTSPSPRDLSTSRMPSSA